MSNRIYTALTDLAACLCVQVEEDGLAPLCYCGVQPGAFADFTLVGQGCKGGASGMAWVRLVTGYPSSVVGEADLTPGNCNKTTGLEFEIGIIRPSLPPGPNGAAPSPEVIAFATEQQIDEMLTMKKAVECCATNNSSKNWVLGSYGPIGPEGMLVGGFWTLAVGL